MYTNACRFENLAVIQATRVHAVSYLVDEALVETALVVRLCRGDGGVIPGREQHDHDVLVRADTGPGELKFLRSPRQGPWHQTLTAVMISSDINLVGTVSAAPHFWL